MAMNFQNAQRAWESTWVNGPPENPDDDYAEYLAELSDEALDTEIGFLAGCDEMAGQGYFRAMSGLAQARAERCRRAMARENEEEE